MGTNYYRIPTNEEMIERKLILTEHIDKLVLSPHNIESEFRTISPRKDWEWLSAWEIFLEDTKIHLGKRSHGWKFCWNFNKDKFYSDKESLLEYIRSGRVVDEYGTEWFPDEFIEMALTWFEPDGMLVNEEYRKEQRKKGVGSFFDRPEYDDKIIDGLRVSTSTDFC